MLEWLHAKKQAGHRLILATASHVIIADKVAQYLDLFDEVMATNGDINLESTAKAHALIGRFSEGVFDYIGNSWPDLQVWAKAHTAHLVDAPTALLKSALKNGNVGRVFDKKPSTKPMALLKAIRLHQWIKNILVFVPLLTAHQYGNYQRGLLAFIAFIVFNITSSSVYLMNDLLDVQDDRHHPLKCKSPLASGQLSLISGWIAWLTLLLYASLMSLLFLPVLFSISLTFYLILTVAYSFQLKKYVLIDVLTLAVLYTLRIISGAIVIDVALSFWLLLFSMFFFLSLALIKRYSELKAEQNTGNIGTLRGRGYVQADLELVCSLGTSAGFIAVLVLALYIEDGQASHLYGYPQFIWLACPLMLFWISRAWLIAHRGKMHSDPIVFALKDKVSWGVGMLVLCVFALARVL